VTNPGVSAQAPPPSGFLRGAKLALQLLLTVAITWFILKAVGFDLQELRAFDLSTLSPRWGLLALSALILLVAYLFSAALWGLMVRQISGFEVGFVPSIRVFFTANLGRYIPGKLWQIAGLAYLAKGEGVPAGTAMGAAVLGQAFSLAGATLLGAGVLLGIGGGASFGGGWAAVVLLALLLTATSPGIFKLLLPLWFRLARQDVPGGFRPDPSFGVRWMGLYALGWTLQGVAFWVLVRGLGFDLSVLKAVPAYSGAYVAGYVFLMAPAGVGIRESILVGILGPVVGAGAAVIALAARLWTTLVELVPALFLASGYIKRGKEGVERRV
jgi:hypothetical protein